MKKPKSLFVIPIIILASISLYAQPFMFRQQTDRVSLTFFDVNNTSSLTYHLHFLHKDPNLSHLNYKIIPHYVTPKWGNVSLHVNTRNEPEGRLSLQGAINFFTLKTDRFFSSCITDSAVFHIALTDPISSYSDTLRLVYIFTFQPYDIKFTQVPLADRNSKVNVVNLDTSFITDNINLFMNPNYCRSRSIVFGFRSRTTKGLSFQSTLSFKSIVYPLTGQWQYLPIEFDSPIHNSLYHKIDKLSRSQNVNGQYIFECFAYDPLDSATTHVSGSIRQTVCGPRAIDRNILQLDRFNSYCLGDSININYDSNFYKNLIINKQPIKNNYFLADTVLQVEALDFYKCLAFDTIKLNTQTPYNEKICLVTVDSATGKNAVIYNKSFNQKTKSYRIYKQTTVLGQYDLVDERSFNQPNVYVDDNSIPEAFSESYRIAVVDSCENISAFSGIHKTMHLSASLGLNNRIELRWDPYDGLIYPSINIYRGSSPNQMQLLITRPSNTISYSDINPPAGNLYYQLEIVAPDICQVYRNSEIVVSSKSNIEKINSTDTYDPLASLIKVYPNPIHQFINLEVPTEFFGFPVQIFNAWGELVFSQIIHQNKSRIDIKNIQKGLLFIKCNNWNKILIKA